MVGVGNKTIPTGLKDALDKPITMEELHLATHKAPGNDRICQEFFKATWEKTKNDILAILNQMFVEGKISDQQKHGVIVRLHKTTRPSRPEDFRPITLMNSDYKLMAQIIANRLRPLLTDLLQPSQHCGVSGNIVFEPLAAVREGHSTR